MPVKTPKEIEDLQRRLSNQFQHFLRPRQPADAARAAPPPPADLPTLISAARTNLDTALRQRDELVRQADLRVERRKQHLAALEAELKRLRDQAAPAPASAEPAPAAPDAAPAPSKPKGTRK
jgi:hypothetical protein